MIICALNHLLINELYYLVRISGTVKKLRPWRRCVMCCKAVRKELIYCCPNCKVAFAYMAASTTITKTFTVKFAS
jgi:predicted nucleic acid-binding Zn ribbon protein